MRTSWLALLAPALSVLGCSETATAPASPFPPTDADDGQRPAAPTPTGAAATCLPEFPEQRGWLAGDGARSIPLPDGRSIHLFGDTLLGPVDASDPRGRTMVSNTVGVSECRDGRWSIEYFWRDTGGERAAIFAVEGEHVWPSEGFLVDGRLHVILSKIVRVDHGLKFDYAGSILATVDDPAAPPREWVVRYATLSSAREFRPTKGVTVHDGYANVFTELPVGEYPHPVLLMRVPTGGLDAPADHLEYLAKSRTWKPISGWTAEDSLVIAERMGPSMYVHHHPGLGRWLTLGVDPDNRRHVVTYVAEALEGPWARGGFVHRFSEIPDALPDGGEVHIACYAVTEHPQLRRDDGHTLVVTYSCNRTRDFDLAAEDLDLFRPKAITVDVGAP